MAVPSVSITVADNGANASLQLPQQNLQVVLGVATVGSGLQNIPVAASQASTLASTFGAGPLVEAGGLVCNGGGVVIAMALAIATLGTATAVQSVSGNTSTSVVTVSLDGTYGAYDTYFVMMKVIKAGTIGTTGIQIQVSLDAGRSFGPIISLGTAVTYAISNTGITLNFAAGTFVAGDSWKFSTTAPAPNSAGIVAALTALGNGPYANSGWGSLHVVGATTSALVTSIQSSLDTFATQFVFTRAILESRDALAPTAWGGSGETSATWVSSLTSAFSASSAKRVAVSAGYYNMPTAFPNASAGLPAYRRPLSWADAVRRVQVPPQRRGGRVKDGSLSNITVDPTTDPADGFIYFDSKLDPTLDTARFMTAMTWPKKQGFYICHENLMSPTGSQFTDLTLGNVIDVACAIGYATAVDEISDDLTLTEAGTLVPTDALTFQQQIDGALAAGMTNVAMCSDAFSSVSQTANVRTTGNIPIQITVNPRGYVNSITETINLQAG